MRRSKRVNHEAISAAVISEKSVEELEEAHEFLTLLSAWKKKAKLNTTYIKGTRKAIEYNGNSRIYCDFRLGGTVTGRLSCAGYRAGNQPMGVSFHTLPRDENNNIRNFFVAPPGWDFITADFGTMEMRILAHVSQDPNMIAAFESGIDFHTYTASLVFEKDPSKVTKAERQIAKSVSFLIVYGGQAYRLSKTANVSMAVAERTLESYQNAYPGIFEWMDGVHQELAENKYVESIFGRRRHLPNIVSNNSSLRAMCQRQGANFAIQSPASDVLCFCLLDITKEFEKEGMKSYVTATVHDSIETLSPREETEKAARIVYDMMMDYPSLKQGMGFECIVPLKVDLEIGPSFGIAKPVEVDEDRNFLNLDEVLVG